MFARDSAVWKELTLTVFVEWFSSRPDRHTDDDFLHQRKSLQRIKTRGVVATLIFRDGSLGVWELRRMKE